MSRGRDYYSVNHAVMDHSCDCSTRERNVSCFRVLVVIQEIL